jgi:hypothetical protein
LVPAHLYAALPEGRRCDWRLPLAHHALQGPQGDGLAALGQALPPLLQRADGPCEGQKL